MQVKFLSIIGFFPVIELKFTCLSVLRDNLILCCYAVDLKYELEDGYQSSVIKRKPVLSSLKSAENITIAWFKEKLFSFPEYTKRDGQGDSRSKNGYLRVLPGCNICVSCLHIYWYPGPSRGDGSWSDSDAVPYSTGLAYMGLSRQMG